MTSLTMKSMSYGEVVTYGTPAPDAILTTVAGLGNVTLGYDNHTT
jgi:hypothetical protein